MKRFKCTLVDSEYLTIRTGLNGETVNVSYVCGDTDGEEFVMLSPSDARAMAAELVAAADKVEARA